MALAPIALFVYNRLDHTRQTLDALRKNILADQSDLIIFSDAAKTEKQVKAVREVRECLPQIEGFKSITIVERPVNSGLANSIIDGVTKVCNDFGKVIVLEDDLVTSPYFLQYMNDALDFYVKEDNVVAIDAYMYPIKSSMPETFFLKDPGCWGWATWQRGWSLFEPDGDKLLAQLKRRNLEKVFDYDGSYPYTQMLIDQIKKKNNSWAIRWYANIFLQDKLALHVGKSLVLNIGNDNSGTHGGKTHLYNVELNTQPVKIQKISLQEDSFARKEIATFLNSTKQSLLRLVFSRLFRFFKATLK
jgi:hypothetical protein